MRRSHILARCTIDFLQCNNYVAAGLGRGTAKGGPEAGALYWRAVDPKETAMKLFSLTRFLRARRAYWSVVQELSNYTDRELHDIGIDRADIHAIARKASEEQH